MIVAKGLSQSKRAGADARREAWFAAESHITASP
jgi:hypothetical protein